MKKEYLLYETFKVNTERISVYVMPDYEIVFGKAVPSLDAFMADMSVTAVTNRMKDQFKIMRTVSELIVNWTMTNKPGYVYFVFNSKKALSLYTKLIKRYFKACDYEMVIHKDRAYVYFKWAA